MRTNPFLILVALVAVASLLLGGGTRSGLLSDAVLQLISIPLFLAVLWRLSGEPANPRLRWALLFCLALVLVPLVQLIPLPPGVWTALPHREPSAAAFELVGREIPWMPISTSPHATWLGALSLLPPLAVFLGTALLGYRDRRRLSLVVLAVGMVSVFVGLIQVAQGPSSPLRFFEYTNLTEAVGFFANRNHFAALLYSLILFAAAWAVNAAMNRATEADQNRFKTAAIVPLLAGFTVLVILVAAQAMARSRAGMGLTIVALAGAFALAFTSRRGSSGVTPTKLIMGATSLAVMFAVQFALYRIMERFTYEFVGEDTRILFARTTIEAAKAYMPFGAGIGTFVPVYGMFEKPQDVMINAYANHAHDDILEWWLEAGVVGIGLMGLFVIWLGLRSLAVWRHTPQQGREIDLSLSRGATIVIALLIGHSFVDYPLRTGAMMAVLTFACALLIDPPAGEASEDDAEVQGTREREAHRAVPRPAPAASPLGASWPSPGPSPEPSATPSRRPGEQWGKEIEWPEAWRKPSQQSSPGGNGKPPKTDKPPGG